MMKPALPPPRYPRRGGRGFTLIELLVAVAIMGALVLMAQATYVVYMRNSVDSTLRHNLFQLRSALQQFYADHGRYPYNGRDVYGNAIGFLDSTSSEMTQGVRAAAANVFPTNRIRYLVEIPLDPSTNQANWRVLPHDNDQDWRRFSDSGTAAPNDFANGEGNGIWDGDPPEAVNDDIGDPSEPNLTLRFGRGDGRPTRGEPKVDEDPFDNVDNDGDGIVDEDPPDVRDVVSSNRDFQHL